MRAIISAKPAEVLKELYDRSKRVIWLNPEARLAWNTGDSEMRKYGAYSHQVEECNFLCTLNALWVICCVR